MNRSEPLLQAALTRLDPWLDAMFPVATALICAKHRLAGHSLLVIYLLLRLLQRSDREPWRWILISLLIVNAGLIIEDRDVRPGGPSDYLIVALSFAAGFQRAQEQWTTSLIWMTSCIVPLLAFSLAAGEKMIQVNSSFAGFNINKIGFLAGLTTVLAYCILKQAKDRWRQATAIALLGAGVGEILLSQSRAALAVPMIAIAADQITWIRSNRKNTFLAASIGILLSATAIRAWYGNSKTGGNALADVNRLETVRCWVDVTLKTRGAPMLGLGFRKTAQQFCGPDRIPSLRAMSKTTGLGHAHNLYVQIFGETGIPGLFYLIGLTAVALRSSWKQKRHSQQAFAFPVVIYLLLMALGITYWQVMMINQVLVGYLLATLSARGLPHSSAGATTSDVPPGAGT